MRKSAILFACFLAFTLSVSAQKARRDIKANISLAGSNYLAYPGPQKQLTAAPAGYEPFYISHYGRHGSRYVIGKDAYDLPYTALLKADSLGKLTPRGREVLAIVRQLRDQGRSRDGELTLLGAQQHRDIARRMYERFPQVFSGNAHIDAKSTVVIRCILSMENELHQLLMENPKLDIRHDASYHDMYYMNHNDTALSKHRMPKEAREAYDAFSKRHIHPERVMRELFNDDSYWQKEVNYKELYKALYKQASNIQSTELRHKMSLYDLFTADELYDLWATTNAWWYINYGPSPLNGGKQPTSQRFLLRKIIHEADSCLKLNHPGATLRYGHDTMVMPLTCLLNLDDTGMQVSDLEQVAMRGWNDYRIFPMACNIQFVFYRKQGSDDILVKILRNENEAKLPVKSDVAPYYHWKDVRAYCERVASSQSPQGGKPVLTD